jgi:hypothetical protein
MVLIIGYSFLLLKTFRGRREFEILEKNFCGKKFSSLNIESARTCSTRMNGDYKLFQGDSKNFLLKEFSIKMTTILTVYVSFDTMSFG